MPSTQHSDATFWHNALLSAVRLAKHEVYAMEPEGYQRFGTASMVLALTHLSYWRYNDVMDLQEHRLTIRLSAEVVDALKALAKAHSRSLNGEVDWALRGYIARQKRERKREQWP